MAEVGVGTHAGATREQSRRPARHDPEPHHATVVALAAVEPPVSLDAEAVRRKDEGAQGHPAARPGAGGDVARAQLASGMIGSKPAKEGLSWRSRTSIHSPAPRTYATIAASINNWRWQGVPFIFVPANAWPSVTEIAVQFKRPRHAFAGNDTSTSRPAFQMADGVSRARTSTAKEFRSSKRAPAE